jgi:predicted HAD superfamily Cof-like phosphohydrolase
MSDTLSTPTKMLEEFIKTFRGSLDPRLWIKLIKEESIELSAAIEANDRVEMLKEATDVMYVMTGFVTTTRDATDGSLVQDAEIDEWRDAFKEAEDKFAKVLDIFGEDVMKKSFERVHVSNMSKLGIDGKPIFREDGKVLKGPNYKKPYLDDLAGETNDTI